VPTARSDVCAIGRAVLSSEIASYSLNSRAGSDTTVDAHSTRKRRSFIGMAAFSPMTCTTVVDTRRRLPLCPGGLIGRLITYCSAPRRRHQSRVGAATTGGGALPHVGIFSSPLTDGSVC
jgi:hypothetical protein